MDLSYVYIGSAGLGLGFLLSAVLNIYNKSTTSSYIYSMFGISITKIIANSTLFGLGFAVSVLAVSSALIRDLSYPRAQPIQFTIETLLMATLCSSIIFAMTLLRGYTIDMSTYVEFGVLFVKFGLLHILFQFSGVYSEIFPYKKQ